MNVLQMELKKSCISIQQKLALAWQIVAELLQTHAHERLNEGEFLNFSDQMAIKKFCVQF